jgi:hypothetical protein
LRVDDHALPEHAGIAAVSALPERVADDRDRMRIGSLIFFGRKGATECGLHVESVEVVAADNRARDDLVVAGVAQADRRDSLRQQTREHLIAVSIIYIVRIRDGSEA